MHVQIEEAKRELEARLPPETRAFLLKRAAARQGQSRAPAPRAGASPAAPPAPTPGKRQGLPARTGPLVGAGAVGTWAGAARAVAPARGAEGAESRGSAGVPLAARVRFGLDGAVAGVAAGTGAGSEAVVLRDPLR